VSNAGDYNYYSNKMKSEIEQAALDAYHNQTDQDSDASDSDSLSHQRPPDFVTPQELAEALNEGGEIEMADRASNRTQSQDDL
jgi:hypothetical protein